jgi:CrcB protein
MDQPTVAGLLRGRWDLVAVIALGGACGGALRWLVGSLVPPVPGQFPWATFVENVSGCLALGALIVLMLEVWAPSRYVRPFLGVGVLGGYTTFSAYTAETAGLLREGASATALIYLFGSVAAGLVATWFAMTVTRALVAGPRGDGGRRTA